MTLRILARRIPSLSVPQSESIRIEARPVRVQAEPSLKQVLAFGLIAAVAIALLTVVIIPTEPRLQSPALEAGPAKHGSAAKETREAENNPIHAGGISTVRELLRLVKSDSAIRDHYIAEGFDPSCARIDTLDRDTFARVSYRKGTAFALTRPILLLAGERIIRGCGRVFLRARCGNVVVPEGRQDMLPDESFNAQLFPTLPFTPYIAPSTSSPLPPLPAVPLSSTPMGATPYVPWYPAACCVVGSGSRPPASTPESSTWGFVFRGIMMFWSAEAQIEEELSMNGILLAVVLTALGPILL
jgi:hypothetical protein